MKQIEVVAAVIKDGNRIFATQRGYGEFKDMWEFPGGKMEPGEDRGQALEREIMEELDTEIDIGPFCAPWNTTTPPSISPCIATYVR